MNSKNAHEYLPLIQALAAGKTIQVKPYEAWLTWTDYDFGLPAEKYRIKPEEPEPRKFFVLRYADGSGSIFENRPFAENRQKFAQPGSEIFEVIEVLP